MFKKFILIAIMSLIPSFAFATGDAVSTHVWMTAPPADNAASDADKWNANSPQKIRQSNDGTYQILRRGQTAYYCVHNNSGAVTGHDGTTSATPYWTVAATADENAINSAPLFIADGVPYACQDADIGSATISDGAQTADIHVCLDKNCTAVTSQSTSLTFTATNVCDSTPAISPGAYVYVDIDTIPSTGETTCIWVIAG